MIKQILIKNYILIKELLVEFDEKLNVITGETGAGKSIIINAIDLVFASRVSKDVIKSDCDKAVVELTIGYKKNDLSELFLQNGIDNFGDEIIISKEIAQNSVRTRVNGTLVNQDFIKHLKEKIIDIHSQNQTYAFLQPKSHITLLDSYAKDSYGEALIEYKELYVSYRNLCDALEKAKTMANATENQIEFLKFQIDEIEAAEIQDENEDESLKNELNVLENVEKLKELTGASYWALNGDDNSIVEALGSIKMNLTKASRMDESLASTESELIDAAETLQQISSTLRDYSQNLESDTGKLNAIQERIFLLDKLKRKYGNTLSEVIRSLEGFQNEYEQIEFSTQNVDDIEKKIQTILQELDTKAAKISEKRKEHADVLSELIVQKLEKLELPRVRFKVEVAPCEINASGKDKIEFLISTNVSEDLKPLAKVASGGEVSRVMLAIKTIFAKSDDIDTVIFDEIDTGISGKTSQSVAEEISELSNYHQVILITHQAIVASKANKHLYVAKIQGDDTTQVGIYELEGDNRIKALAELAGGEINEQSIEFAKTLIS